jgi:hypothetical protein
MVQELEATKDALVDRYGNSLRAAALKLKTLRGNVEETVEERDRLLRESAPVLQRAQAAEFAGVSLSRVDQILGGRACGR